MYRADTNLFKMIGLDEFTNKLRSLNKSDRKKLRQIIQEEMALDRPKTIFTHLKENQYRVTLLIDEWINRKILVFIQKMPGLAQFFPEVRHRHSL